MNKQEININVEQQYRTRYLEDVLTQPQALRGLIKDNGTIQVSMDKWGDEWEETGKPLIVFTGMGASLFAAEIAQSYLSQNGVFSLVLPTSDLVDRLSSIPKDAFLIAISQSGESIEMRELVDILGPRRLYAVTRVPVSFLAQSAHDVVLLDLLPDLSVAIKTYTGTLSLLMLFAARLVEGKDNKMSERILQAADIIEDQLPAWESEAVNLANKMGRPKYTSFLGRGIDQYSARGAALLFKEGAKLAAEASCGGQFRHGAVEVVDSEHFTIYFVPPNTDRRYKRVKASVEELLNLAGRVVTVGTNVPIQQNEKYLSHLSVRDTEDPIIAAIAGIVPVQLLTAYLAKLAGLEAGEFRNTTPVINHDA
ncbi:SIS domain-containing protein [Neobacillus pocheonensis]|uniref:SIS domain-containing protein n=1 Tax=Neobacillus pocheonensis TaxID=363869 RepID=UPI003D28BCDA